MIKVNTAEFPKIIQSSRFVNLFVLKFDNLKHGLLKLFPFSPKLFNRRVVRIICVRRDCFWEISFHVCFLFGGDKLISEQRNY